MGIQVVARRPLGAGTGVTGGSGGGPDPYAGIKGANRGRWPTTAARQDVDDQPPRTPSTTGSGSQDAPFRPRSERLAHAMVGAPFGGLWASMWSAQREIFRVERGFRGRLKSSEVARW